MEILGIDVGGSGIKGALVNLETGELAGERIRLKTPASFDIDKVSRKIGKLVGTFDYAGPVGVGFPAAVACGTVLTPPTAHHVPGWVGQPVDQRLTAAAGQEVSVLNDADAAGLAEMRFGAGRAVKGVVITVTLGTGVGAGMFMDGKLVPNLEIGKLYLARHTEVVEQYMASRIRTEQKLDWKEYGARLNEFCRHVEHLFSPQLIIIGGGVSRNYRRFLPEIHLERALITPARLRNEAGIVGAAVWAAESTD